MVFPEVPPEFSTIKQQKVFSKKENSGKADIFKNENLTKKNLGEDNSWLLAKFLYKKEEVLPQFQVLLVKSFFLWPVEPSAATLKEKNHMAAVRLTVLR